MGKALRNWWCLSLGQWKIRWAILNITLANLEKAQEARTLTPDKLEFKKYLKVKALGIAAIQKSRARQHSRLTWIRKGYTNTRFFQLHANMRKKKIHCNPKW
jgi:CDP-glycerol glycerophosphotransferase (TagB/SpsB family)